MKKCRKCHRPVHDCPICKGRTARGLFGKLTCSNCKTTGSVCNQHGGYWQ